MDTIAVLPEAIIETLLADLILPEEPYVDPATREAIDLLFECDRVDAIADKDAQKQAMDALLDRVIAFESVVPGSAQREIFH
jgi:hypothetical protein